LKKTVYQKRLFLFIVRQPTIRIISFYF